MKMEYETEIVANMQHWVSLECLDAAPAISSPEFVSEKKYKTFMLHICNMGLNRDKQTITSSSPVLYFGVKVHPTVTAFSNTKVSQTGRTMEAVLALLNRLSLATVPGFAAANLLAFSRQTARLVTCGIDRLFRMMAANIL